MAEITDGPLSLRSDQPPLFAADGSMPVFERRVAENGFAGHAVTETVVITEDGRVVVKQPYLGRDEPDAQKLADAVENGVVLPAQKEDSAFGGDANVMPVVVKIDGEFWLILDYNPRNAREIDGKSVPFDLVSKRLTGDEIAANPDIKAAVGKLSG